MKCTPGTQKTHKNTQKHTKTHKNDFNNFNYLFNLKKNRLLFNKFFGQSAILWQLHNFFSKHILKSIWPKNDDFRPFLSKKSQKQCYTILDINFQSSMIIFNYQNFTLILEMRLIFLQSSFNFSGKSVFDQKISLYLILY